ncbi:MAG: SDR family oxidoreductase [Sphaerochaetaceae bacterium]
MNELFEQAFSLKGQVALITGGASGLGFAMAKCMDAAGAKVVLIGHSSEDKLKEAVAELSQGSSYLYDVTDTTHTKQFIDMVIKEQGSIDILVNNAGVHCKKPVLEIQQSDIQNVLNVHLLGALALSQAVLPEMRERKKGNILFISSMSAFVGLTNVCAYSAAKSALLGLTRSLAAEVSADHVRVNAIAPGFIDTPMFHQATDKDPARKEKILSHTPMRTFGDSMDIGWGAVYLCSPAASFVTGTCLMVDGGFATGF